MTQKKRVLYVEDWQDICELISIILEDYEVISVNSVADALRLATSELFTLYLLDYHLPDGNGVKLTELVRTFDKETPILFVTSTSSLTEKQLLASGAQGLVGKGRIGFVEELKAKVKQVLE